MVFVRSSRYRTVVAAMVAASVALSSTLLRADVVYQITDLGTFGGQNAYANGINNSGQVIGNYNDSNGVSRSFFYSNGAATTLDFSNLPGIVGTASESINNFGNVSVTGRDASGQAIALIYENNQLLNTGINIEVRGINDSNVMVGGSPGGAATVTVDSITGVGTLHNLGTNLFFANSINDSGAITGETASFQAFLYSNNTVTVIPGASQGWSVNNANHVAGDSPAFLWTGSQTVPLGTLGHTSSIATSVNSSDTVVGDVYNSGFTNFAPFIYTASAGMRNINTLLTPTSNLTIDSVSSINDVGQIAGKGIDSLGRSHAVLLTPTNLTPAAPGSRPVYPLLPAHDDESSGLIVLVHGFDSNVNVWATQMAEDISLQLQRKGNASAWDIVPYDWHQWASDPLSGPGLAMQNAKQIGKQIGDQIKTMGYTKIHFIAHSAGAWLIDQAANELAGSGIQIQSTFLDAYVPIGSDKLGATATFAEQYINSGDLPFTQATLPHAYNVDVTGLDPGGSHNIVSGHQWPYQWYEQTVQDPSSSLSIGLGFGFSLAQELTGSLPNTTLFPAGQRIDILATTPVESDQEPVYQSLNVLGMPHVTSSTGGITTPQTNMVRLSTGSPVWVTYVIDTDNPFQFLHFEYQFESNAEGWLSVFIDGQLVLNADERDVTGLNSEVLWLGQEYQSGSHILSFRLDPYSNVQSVVNISNVQIGDVPECSSLLLTMAGSVSILLQRRRSPSRIVQSSANFCSN